MIIFEKQWEMNEPGKLKKDIDTICLQRMVKKRTNCPKFSTQADISEND